MTQTTMEFRPEHDPFRRAGDAGERKSTIWSTKLATMVSAESLVGLAVACGAADAGGPLSASERALIERSSRPSPRAALRARRAIRDGEDPLGEAYLQLRSTLERRSLGAFYTSSAIVDPMVSWALECRPQRLVDPGCGSGRFTVAALRRARDLAVIAVDLDPVATLLTRAAIACVGGRRARVVHGDYLMVRLPKIGGRTAFVGNPPYVRHHDLSAQTKARARVLASRLGQRVSGLAGLHALFYLVTAAEHGRAGDVGSFITSSEWIDVGYGRIVRDIFAQSLGGRSLLVFDAESVPFADAMTTAAITTFRIGSAPAHARFGHIESANAVQSLEVLGRDVKHSALRRANRWSPLLKGADETFAGQSIGTMFRVSRGQVTGANDFFVMTRAEARARMIEEFCVPLVTSADEVFAAGGILRDGTDRMVGLAVPREADLSRHARLAAYVSGGEAAGVHEGYVASRRRPWYAVAFPRPPIVATYMARQPPAFARNPDGLGLLNVAHGLYPRAPLDDAMLDRIVEHLNATRERFAGRGRRYHGGLEKFEPREMEALPLTIKS